MLQFKIFKFSELTLEQLYILLKLRAEIFIVEQACAFLDPDGKDFVALHLIGTEQNNIIAYLRIFPPTEIQTHITFGRVLTATSARGKNYGKKLITELLNFCEKNFPQTSIQCSAQLYLKKFYESFGFRMVGKEYLEDNMPHIEMHLSKSRSHS